MSSRTIEEVIAELTEITEELSDDKSLLKVVQSHLGTEMPPGLHKETAVAELQQMREALRKAELVLFENICEVQSTIGIINHLIATIESQPQ